MDQTLMPFFVANNIHKKNEYDLYALIDITNKPKKFFEEQKLVKFKKIWYYHDFLNKDVEITEDLSEKLRFYKDNPKIAKKVAKNGQKKYFKLFNGKDVANYIVKRSLNNDPKFKPLWEKIDIDSN